MEKPTTSVPAGNNNKAVPLVKIDPDDKFALTPEGAKLFESQSGPFGVMIVTGLYRTGKSYLLDQLIGDKDAFTVDPTTQSCTRGIWAASTISDGNACVEKMVKTSKGEMMVYFMDCEGFGAVEKSLNFDVKLFTLSVLLGSYLVYNSFNSLDETAIQQLSYLFVLRPAVLTHRVISLHFHYGD